jgi:hypothetical protein
MGDATTKTDIDWRLGDLAQEHAERILVEVMHRRRYSGETLVQLVEAMRRFERAGNDTRRDVAERLVAEQARRARDAKKRAERKKAASK